MDPEHVRLLVKDVAREISDEVLTGAEERIEQAIARGIDLHFSRLGVGVEHFLWVRHRYEAERSNWSIARKAVISLVLVSVLVFAGHAAWERVMAKIVISSERGGRPLEEVNR